MIYASGLTFDDVLIMPNYSDVASRIEPDTTTRFLDLPIPLISANMDTVTGTAMCVAMEQAGGLGVLHRFMGRQTMLDAVRWVAERNKHVAVSLGIGRPDKFVEWAKELIKAGANVLVLDVAHGHQSAVMDCIAKYDHTVEAYDVPLIAGNVATHQGAHDLWRMGADGIKVGIGHGAACTTRTVNGVGMPQLTAIEQTCVPDKYNLIADGGVKGTADFVKAIAAGADAVMCGSLFAGCDESPGEWVDGKKVYRGSSSAEARRQFGMSDRIAEGKSGSVPATGPVAHVMEQYQAALQSAMSYVGARTLDEFRARARFVKVTQATLEESRARI